MKILTRTQNVINAGTYNECYYRAWRRSRMRKRGPITYKDITDWIKDRYDNPIGHSFGQIEILYRRKYRKYGNKYYD